MSSRLSPSLAVLVLSSFAGCGGERQRCEGPDTTATVSVSRHFDGSYEGVQALVALPDGDILVAGGLADARPPDSDAPNVSGGRPMIGRVDSEGEIVARRDFGEGDGVVRAVALGVDGGLFMAGSTGEPSITLKNVLENATPGPYFFPSLAFAARLDPSTLEPLWDFGLAGEFDRFAVVADTAGGVVVGGQSTNATDRKTDAYLAGLDRQSGALQWELRVVSDRDARVVGLAAAPSGDVVAAISVLGAVQEGVTAPLPTFGDSVGATLLLALDPATGTERWAKILGDGTAEGSSLGPRAFVGAADGTLALAGVAGSGLALGLGEVPGGAIAVRLDAQGEPLAQHTFTSDGPIDVGAIAFAGDGGLLVGGDFSVGSFGSVLRVDGRASEPTVKDTSIAGYVAGFSPSDEVRFAYVLPAVDNVQPGDAGIIEVTAVAPGAEGSVMVGARLSGIAHLASCDERSSENGDALILRIDP
ncbi:hypothetical protein [Nannocystis radixulma]|uniref:Uncharacterized protein n=1 Tax=Nannocystis radixulma TaxID=2995305 RepID=A0ABT5BF94_9BACT|nr:hypothetical protein [Nannocystis radixulma]MDC0672814.1 hypothetical protein [Nannocystis radixulma]